MQIIIDDGRWYYTRHGRSHGSSLVFLHGAGSNHGVWGGVVRYLRPLSCYCPDLPGHGRSDGPALRSVETMAHAVEAWIEKTVGEPVTLVGHSMGGAVALALGLEPASRVHRIVLVTTGARLRIHPDLLGYLKSGKKEEAARWIAKGSLSSEASEDIRNKLMADLHRCRMVTLRRDFLACHAFDVMERLGRVRVPTLVIGAEQDQMTPLKYARRLAEEIPTADLAVIPRSGHMVMLEQPRSLAEQIAAWLSRTTSSRDKS